MEANGSPADTAPEASRAHYAEESVEALGRGEDDISEEEVLRPLTAVDRQYAVQSGVPERIHIVGTGSIGKLVAHSLRGAANPPPVTLIFHRYGLVKAWERSRKEITIQDDEYKVPRGGFDVELLPTVVRQHGVEVEDGQAGVYDAQDETKPHEVAEVLTENIKRTPSELRKRRQAIQDEEKSGATRRNQQYDNAISQEPIHNLIVTTKAAHTIPALNALKNRLSSSTTICFLQNGMGIVDDVNKNLFPDETNRPNYIQGIITHGVNVPPEVAARDPFFAVHAGYGTIALGILPRAGVRQTFVPDAAKDTNKPRSEKWAPSARYLLRTLTRIPVLCAVGFAPLELLQQQLEKLAVNSVLNPLTSLLDDRNGSLLYNFALTRTMRLLLAETSLVIRSLPELHGVPNVDSRFSAERLEWLCVSIAHKTQDNISSMLADVRAGRRTEIEYINGYIVRRGEELGVKCVVNYAIMQTVIGKCLIAQHEKQEAVPLEGRRRLNTED